MHTIEATDIVWASATYRGRTVATFSSTGFTSLADVVRAVRLAVGTLAGASALPSATHPEAGHRHAASSSRPSQPAHSSHSSNNRT